MLTIYDHMEDYLLSSYYIDWKNENIINTARNLFTKNDDIKTVENTYVFVRDKIKHSWDVQDRRVTVRASDVLKQAMMPYICISIYFQIIYKM